MLKATMPTKMTDRGKTFFAIAKSNSRGGIIETEETLGRRDESSSGQFTNNMGSKKKCRQER